MSSSIEEQWLRLAIDQSGRGSNEWKPCLPGCESVTMTHYAMYPGSSWYNSLRSRQNTAISDSCSRAVDSVRNLRLKVLNIELNKITDNIYEYLCETVQV